MWFNNSCYEDVHIVLEGRGHQQGAQRRILQQDRLGSLCDERGTGDGRRGQRQWVSVAAGRGRLPSRPRQQRRPARSLSLPRIKL